VLGPEADAVAQLLAVGEHRTLGAPAA
jgi:hypothetical protein